MRLSFLKKLQMIVEKYNFANYNGINHHINGLPDMFGISLSIYYKSGEYITIYDNQDSILPLDSLEELENLFYSKCKKSKTLSNDNSKIVENLIDLDVKENTQILEQKFTDDKNIIDTNTICKFIDEDKY